MARRNLATAKLADAVEIVEGSAANTLARLPGPFDLVFLDADKPSNPEYLAWALRLTRPGSLIIGDNVVREGAVVAGEDPSSEGARRFLELLAADPRVSATVIQTVGVKGWDGMAIARVVG